MSTPALEVAGLQKAYARDGRTLRVLDLARLSVGDGEFVTVVGPSGCGKATLLHVLGGFIPYDAGQIRVHGRAVAVNPAMAAGTALVGSFLFGATLAIRDGMRISMTNSDQADFTKNLVAVRAEIRCALTPSVPPAFGLVTGLVAS